MDINEKINWMPGIELTAETFRIFENSLDYRQRLALRIALGSNRPGLLPDAPFECGGMFVRNTFEIENLRCTALLRSGRVIDADERVSVSIPMLYGDEYYLAAGISEELHEYERNGVPCIRHSYSFGIHTMDDLQRRDVFPLLRFFVADGVLTLDPKYIAPVIFISGNQRIDEFRKSFAGKLEQICAHRNLEEGDGKLAMLRYLFRLNSVSPDETLRDFTVLTQELAQAVDYFIVRPNTESAKEIPLPDILDIEKWLAWLEGFLAAAIEVLNKVVIVDNTIDYEALLEQAKKELYERLSVELNETLPKEIRDSLYKDLIEKLKSHLAEYLLEKLREQKVEISGEITTAITPALFDDLYKKLYEALYVKPEEEEEFMPLI